MTLNILSLGMAFAVGLGLGYLHFGGLWLTVQRVAAAQQPYLLLWASALGRLAISIVGFYGVLVWGGGLHLLVCMSGFLGMRYFLIRHERLRLRNFCHKE